MAVEAMVAVVKQKLTDMLKEEAVCRHKMIVHQLNEIGKSLDKIREELKEAEDKPEMERAATEYLRIVYQVEDEIERFAFRQGKSKGFLMRNHSPFFLNNLKTFRKLRSKLKRTVSGKSIGDDDDEDASIISSKHGDQSQSINYGNNNHSPALRRENDDNDDRDQEVHHHHHIDNKTNSASQVRTTISLNRSQVQGPGTRLVSIEEDQQTVVPRYCSEGEEVVPNSLRFKKKKKLLKRQSSFSDGEEEFTLGFKAERLKYPKKMSSFSYGDEELGIIGFKEHVDKLVKRLTRKGDLVVPIFGEVGSGKTTMARAIYRHTDIKECFDCRAWVSVLKHYTETDILLSLLKQLNGGCCSSKSKSKSKDQSRDLIPEQLLQLKIRLSEMLKEKVYLVVLDDLHTFHLWEKLKDYLPDTMNGSKILFTTCDPNPKIQRNLPHILERLSERDSWDLFLKKANPLSMEAPPDVKQNILETCNGRPVYIELLGGLLSSKNVEDWSSSVPPRNHKSDVLWLCYNDLPAHYKLCLLYLVLFPKHLDIPVRRLLRLWLAEGFVDRLVKSPSSDGVPVPEDVVLKCFEDLVNRNMIQISKLRSDNSPRKCYLIGALHDYLLPKALEISLFYVHRNLDYNKEAGGPFGIRRMVEYADIKGVFGRWPMGNNEEQQRGESESISCFCFSSGMQQSQKREGINSVPSRRSISSVDSYENFSLDPSCFRSYLSFNLQKKDTPAREVGRFLGRIIDNGFGLLRVLDLEGVYKPSLPHRLGDLHHLRYLGLRWTFLDTLPQSVCDLPNLETLDVKRTCINEIPNSIWKAKHLRHLNLNDIRLDMPKERPGPIMSLHTLWGLFVDEKSLVRNGINKLVDLRELGITFHLTSSEIQSDLFGWIATLTALQSLRLRSKDDRGRPSGLNLTVPLSSLEKLSHLNLLGKLQTLPRKDGLPPNLKVLTLSVSLLKEDPMPTLGQLPMLTVLRLLANSYLGGTMVCRKGTFPSLQVLKLWTLKKLVEWDVEEGAMQNLKELNIRSCDRLKCIPPTLLWLRTLDELILSNMPKDFIDTIPRRMSNQTSLTVKDWEVTPLPWEEEDDSDDNTQV